MDKREVSRGGRVVDLKELISDVKFAREDLPEKVKSIEPLRQSLEMALAWHVAVVFGQ